MMFSPQASLTRWLFCCLKLVLDNQYQNWYYLWYMKKLQLFVTEEQANEVKKLALAKGISIAQLHRTALDEYLTSITNQRIAHLEDRVFIVEQRLKKLENR